jgi:hypothetical protein
VPIYTRCGHAIGTRCAIDRPPRNFDSAKMSLINRTREHRRRQDRRERSHREAFATPCGIDICCHLTMRGKRRSRLCDRRDPGELADTRRCAQRFRLREHELKLDAANEGEWMREFYGLAPDSALARASCRIMSHLK